MSKHRKISSALLAAFMGTTASFADGLLFDFGSDATPTIGGVSGPAETWNNVTSIGTDDFGMLDGLLNTEGEFTFLGLQMVARFNGPNESGTASSSLYPSTATRDSLYGNTEEWQGLVDIMPVFKIYGLDTSATYTFTFYASRTGVGDNRETRYTVTGTTEQSVELDAANNITNTVSVSNVVPTDLTEVTIALTPGPNNNNANHFTYINVLEIESSTGERVLIDFGASGSPTEFVEAPPSPFWNNIGPVVGASDIGLLGGIVTTNGTFTEVSLQMEARFNTFNGNGTTASTIYPTTATQDSLFGNTGEFNGISDIEPAFKLTGLDPDFQYTFTFYGSRTGVSDNRETRYTVTGENSGEALLDTANNVDATVTVADIRPTEAGEIRIALSAGPNNNNSTRFTYLGVMQVDFAPIRTPRIKIDFGGANTTDVGDDPFDTWNNVTLAVATADDGVLSDLLRTDGSATAIGVQMVSRFNGANENGTQAGLDDGAPYPIDATRDSLFGNTELFSGLENITPIFKLTGLNSATAYDLTFYASRMGVSDNRETRYTITGASETFTDLNAANNEFETAVVNDVLPDSNGEITIALAPGPNNDNGNHFTYLGALQLDWEGGDEPAPAPTISDAEFTDGTFRFTVNGAAGATYTVQRTTDFSAWEDIETVTLAADSEEVEIAAPADAAFYQLVAE